MFFYACSLAALPVSFLFSSAFGTILCTGKKDGGRDNRNYWVLVASYNAGYGHLCLFAILGAHMWGGSGTIYVSALFDCNYN